MPQRAWNKKRERQYEHIKEGLQDRGRSADEAEEVAARTVNKERARSGESREASRTSVDDISSGRRGGLRSHRGPGGRTKAQLYEEAKDKGIPGRSRMSKQELERAVGRDSVVFSTVTLSTGNWSRGPLSARGVRSAHPFDVRVTHAPERTYPPKSAFAGKRGHLADATHHHARSTRGRKNSLRK